MISVDLFRTIAEVSTEGGETSLYGTLSNAKIFFLSYQTKKSSVLMVLGKSIYPMGPY